MNKKPQFFFISGKKKNLRKTYKHNRKTTNKRRTKEEQAWRHFILSQLKQVSHHPHHKTLTDVVNGGDVW